MSAISSTSMMSSMANLTRRSQYVLDGMISAILIDGTLVVDVGRGSLYCGSIIDRVFRAGELSRLMRDEDGKYLAIGLAPTGGASQTTALRHLVDTGGGSKSSASLQAAFWRVVDKQSRVLKPGTINAVRLDGELEIQLKRGGGIIANRFATTQRFRASQPVHVLKMDSGAWLVVGSTARGLTVTR